MPWRSSSFTIAEESSKLRSVNRGVICGAVTRRMRKPKKATSATVTAHMAAIRAAPSDLRKSSNPCTGIRPGHIRPGKICLAVGSRPVNFRAIDMPKRRLRPPNATTPPMRRGGDAKIECSLSVQAQSVYALLPVLLDARRAQAGKAMLVDGILPGEGFLDGQRLATTEFL